MYNARYATLTTIEHTIGSKRLVILGRTSLVSDRNPRWGGKGSRAGLCLSLSISYGMLWDEALTAKKPARQRHTEKIIGAVWAGKEGPSKACLASVSRSATDVWQCTVGSMKHTHLRVMGTWRYIHYWLCEYFMTVSNYVTAPKQHMHIRILTDVSCRWEEERWGLVIWDEEWLSQQQTHFETASNNSLILSFFAFFQ